VLARAGIEARAIRVLRNPVTPWSRTRIPAEQNRDVLFVGRLDGDKGADLLARAARHAGAALRIVGDGPLAASIARDNPEARLLGWRTREQITQLIGSARLVVSPTRCRETFGLVPLEALMSGIPVVLSRLFPISDEVARRGFGLVCDPFDEPALAATIGGLLRDDERVRQMSLHGFAEARTLAPTREQWCDELVALYRSRIGDGSALRPLQASRSPHRHLAGSTAASLTGAAG
jgi:glycosyltransferase involved in cell wall biosynthesis